MKPGRRIRPVPVIVGAVAIAAVAVTAFVFAVRDSPSRSTASPARQSEVAAKGRKVMPFDLDRTTHRFEKNATGGVQTVVADDPGDRRQIQLIQEHLVKEAAGFSRGDYADPASIHGSQMPGLRDLERGHGRIAIRQAPLAAGAKITFTTSDPSMVRALHAWFDAQTSDHGGHAEHQ